MRVAEVLAADEYDVGGARGEDLLGLRGRRDEPDGAGRHVGVLADARGERHLVTGADGDLLVRDEPARRHVDEVDSGLARPPGDGCDIVDVEAAGRPVRRGDAQQKRHVGADGRAHGAHDVEQEPRPAGEVPAPRVGARVRQRGEELVEEVAVRAVDLDRVESCVDGPSRGGGEVVDDAADAFGGERGGCRVPVKREGRRRDGRPTAVGGRHRA
nr:hypothetical protein [Sanguibacter massiliensis]